MRDFLFSFPGMLQNMIHVILVVWIWYRLTLVAESEYLNLTSLGPFFLSRKHSRDRVPAMNKYGRGPVPREQEMAMSRLKLIKILTFWGGPVQYFKKLILKLFR